MIRRFWKLRLFGTGDYYRAHFSNPLPEINLRGPARLGDFLVDDHLELSLRGYLELVLENNTQIAIQKAPDRATDERDHSRLRDL